MSSTLFPGHDTPQHQPDWFTAGKTTPVCHTANVRRGRHPFGLPLLQGDGSERCGSCGHRLAVKHNTKTYHKCAVHPQSSGPGTDLRLCWAACELYEPEADHD